MKKHQKIPFVGLLTFASIVIAQPSQQFYSVVEKGIAGYEYGLTSKCDSAPISSLNTLLL